jgi:long-chain fatty acid transport protein
MTRRWPKLACAAGALLASLATREAFASGFSLDDFSARGLGTAYSGEAAAAEDPTTLFYNVAGATRLPGSQLSLSGELVHFNANFEDHGSTVNPRVGNERLRGAREVNGGEIASLASLFVTHQLFDRVWVGLAVAPPYGLSIDYDTNWVGRYHALLSDMKTVDVAPSIAVKVTDTLSFGAGLDVQYVYAKLTSSLDLGTACELYAPQFGLPPSACAAVGLKPQSADGYIRVRGDSWAVGYNLGVLWEPMSGTRVGLSYRSRVDHTLDADAQFRVPKKAAILQQTTGALVDSAATAELNLPELVRLGLYQEITPRFAILTGIEWTHWSRFDELVLDFANPKQPPIVQPEKWQDTLRVGLGLLYRVTDLSILRAGFAYDETPVPNEFRRTPRIPDHDRYWASLGASTALTDTIRIDVGYAHLFSQNAKIDNPDPVTGNVLRGSYSGSGDLFGAQLTWRFH